MPALLAPFACTFPRNPSTFSKDSHHGTSIIYTVEATTYGKLEQHQANQITGPLPNISRTNRHDVIDCELLGVNQLNLHMATFLATKLQCRRLKKKQNNNNKTGRVNEDASGIV